MTIAELAAQAVKILVPFVASSARKLASEAAKVALGKVEVFIAELKQRWSGDDFARKTLERFESDPERYAAPMEDALKEEMEKHESFVSDVQEMVQSVGPTLLVIQELEDVGDATGIKIGGDVRSGNLETRQTVKRANTVTGTDVGGDVGS